MDNLTLISMYGNGTRAIVFQLCRILIFLVYTILNQDIMFNRTIKDALVAEEKFFRSRPVLIHHIL